MHNEKVFTPDRMVSLMLDEIGYYGEDILCKHIMDNSCGEGAFLVQAIQRYIFAYKSKHGNCKGLCDELKTYIHGIEIDCKCWKKCFENCQDIVREYCDEEDFSFVNFDIINADSTDSEIISRYMFKMDYIVGNPPYCNVHHFGDNYDKYKRFEFAKDGMSDLYIIFFEISILMCNNDSGKIAYITPSSWLTSVAGKKLRWYLEYTGTLSVLVKFGHYQVFDTVTTYSMITVMDFSDKGDTFTVKDFDEDRYAFKDGINKGYSDCFIKGKLYPDSDDTFKEIMEFDGEKKICVKNGFATLNDKLFITKYCTDNTIPVIKASTGECKNIIYPYDHNGNPLTWYELGNNTREYLERKLLELGEEKKEGWYLYGRTQAINDVPVEKVSMNNLIRDTSDLILRESMPWSGVYSGFYAVCNDDNYSNISLYNIISMSLHDDAFIEFVTKLGKYKSGGYYTYNTKDLEQYINWFLNLNILT